MTFILAFVFALVSAVRGCALCSQMQNAAGYGDLTQCLQYCIAGNVGNYAASASWVVKSGCSTIACICKPEEELRMGEVVGDCQKVFSDSCADTTPEDGDAVAWVANYCNWMTSVMTFTVSPSNTSSSPAAASTSPPSTLPASTSTQLPDPSEPTRQDTAPPFSATNWTTSAPTSSAVQSNDEGRLTLSSKVLIPLAAAAVLVGILGLRVTRSSGSSRPSERFRLSFSLESPVTFIAAVREVLQQWRDRI